jgi:hypothetical protein
MAVGDETLKAADAYRLAFNTADAFLLALGFLGADASQTAGREFVEVSIS